MVTCLRSDERLRAMLRAPWRARWRVDYGRRLIRYSYCVIKYIRALPPPLPPAPPREKTNILCCLCGDLHVPENRRVTVSYGLL